MANWVDIVDRNCLNLESSCSNLSTWALGFGWRAQTVAALGGNSVFPLMVTSHIGVHISKRASLAKVWGLACFATSSMRVVGRA